MKFFEKYVYQSVKPIFTFTFITLTFPLCMFNYPSLLIGFVYVGQGVLKKCVLEREFWKNKICVLELRENGSTTVRISSMRPETFCHMTGGHARTHTWKSARGQMTLYEQLSDQRMKSNPKICETKEKVILKEFSGLVATQEGMKCINNVFRHTTYVRKHEK